MSWSRHFQSRKAFVEQDKTHQIPDGAEDQYNAACAAAQSIIASGIVGDDREDVTVYLAGHSNPLHRPKEGFATDTVTVTVTQIDRNPKREPNPSPLAANRTLTREELNAEDEAIARDDLTRDESITRGNLK